jgi:hypothetical protein
MLEPAVLSRVNETAQLNQTRKKEETSLILFMLTEQVIRKLIKILNVLMLKVDEQLKANE